MNPMKIQMMKWIIGFEVPMDLTREAVNIDLFENSSFSMHLL